jgi:hypothetical protein
VSVRSDGVLLGQSHELRANAIRSLLGDEVPASGEQLDRVVIGDHGVRGDERPVNGEVRGPV